MINNEVGVARECLWFLATSPTHNSDTPLEPTPLPSMLDRCDDMRATVVGWTSSPVVNQFGIHRVASDT